MNAAQQTIHTYYGTKKEFGVKRISSTADLHNEGHREEFESGDT